MQMFLEGTFPYQHVIIDEGQDFGKEEIDEVEIIELLREKERKGKMGHSI